MEAKLLIVEDEDSLRASLKEYFERELFEVAVAADGRRALQMLDHFDPDMVILDVQLPHTDGLEVCRVIRQRVGHAVGIVMISGIKKETLDRVIGLEIGADAYLTKPFETRELLAQVRALLRRVTSHPPDTETGGWLRIDDYLRIDFDRRLVEVDGREVHLTRLEFDLLQHLASKPGVPCARSDLLDAVWGYEDGLHISDSAINTRVRRLREKIEPDPSNPRYIQAVHGLGYRFREL